MKQNHVIPLLTIHQWLFSVKALELCVRHRVPRGNRISDALRLPLRHSDKHTHTLAAVKKTFCRLGSQDFCHAAGRGGWGTVLERQMTSLGLAVIGTPVTTGASLGFGACDHTWPNINPLHVDIELHLGDLSRGTIVFFF